MRQSSCSTADWLVLGRRRTHDQDARRIERRAPRFASSKGFYQASDTTASAVTGVKKLGHPLPESNFVSEENRRFPHAAQT